jgi:hypothetical protein
VVDSIHFHHSSSSSSYIPVIIIIIKKEEDAESQTWRIDNTRRREEKALEAHGAHNHLEPQKKKALKAHTKETFSFQQNISCPHKKLSNNS